MPLLREKNQLATKNQAETGHMAEKMPPAGPHARPELTNYDACPGAGALPSEREMGAEADPGAG